MYLAGLIFKACRPPSTLHMPLGTWHGKRYTVVHTQTYTGKQRVRQKCQVDAELAHSSVVHSAQIFAARTIDILKKSDLTDAKPFVALLRIRPLPCSRLHWSLS
jgi:hypothetical protein